MLPYTGHISPRFHVTFGEYFKTIKGSAQKVKSELQMKAGLASK